MRWSYSISAELRLLVSLSALNCKLSDLWDSGLVGGLRRRIAKWRSRDPNFGCFRITTGFTSSLWMTWVLALSSFVCSMWLRKYFTVSCKFLICILIFASMLASVYKHASVIISMKSFESRSRSIKKTRSWIELATWKFFHNKLD